MGLLLAIPATVASVYGARLAVDIDRSTFDTLLATFMVIFAVLLILKPQRYIKSKFNPNISIVLLFLAFLFIGIYGGALQAGVGFFIIRTLLLLVPQIPMGEMHGIKTLVVTIYISVSTFALIFNGLFDWKFAVSHSSGSDVTVP